MYQPPVQEKSQRRSLSRCSGLRTQAICLRENRSPVRIQDLDRNRDQRINARITVRERAAEMQMAVQDRKTETTAPIITGITDRMGKTVRTVRQVGKIVLRAALTIGTIMAKAVRAGVLVADRIIRTTGTTAVATIARIVKTAEMTVPRDVLTMEKTVPVSPARIVSRAASEARMREEEIPEEIREINLKHRIWNL